MGTWMRVFCAVSVATVLAGCPAMIKPKKRAEVEGVESAPVRYSDFNQGLPTGRIWKTQVAVGDVNGDGFPDLGLVSRLADGPWIYVGDGNGNWRPAANGLPREPFCGGGMAFADMNNDGKMDVAIGDHCKGVFAFFGDGEGNWVSRSSGLPTIGAEDVAVGDFDHDGCTDIVSVAMGEEGVRAFRGNCAGVWSETSDGLALTNWGNAIELADMNADGHLDIAAAYSAGPRVWLGNGKGQWEEASAGLPAPEIQGLYWGIAVGDVNGDGKLDLASGSQMPPQTVPCGGRNQPACSGGGAEVFVQQEDGSWKASSHGILPMNALGVAIGDLNNDGHADLVAVGKQKLDEIGGVYGVFAYLGDGTGQWRLMKNCGLPEFGRERTWGVGLADFDRNGILDIAVAFGDVVSPTWRSGSQIVDVGAPKAAPQRGQFGSIGVWRSEFNLNAEAR